MITHQKPYHPGIHIADQCLDWMPTDTKEHFDNLMQNSAHREYFQNMSWDKPGAITYNLNSEGFRCDEFDDLPCVVALGCSYTMGIGLPVECLWPSLVGQALNLKVFNLAWGGYSADSCFRLARYWLPKLNAKVVCMLAPPQARIELVLAEKCQDSDIFKADTFMPQSQSKYFNPADVYLNTWFMQEENHLINKEKNIFAVQQMSSNIYAKFCVVDTDTTMTRSREDIGYARDHMHGGPKIHREIANTMLLQYEQNQTNISP
jgi:hypothetical protein